MYKIQNLALRRMAAKSKVLKKIYHLYIKKVAYRKKNRGGQPYEDQAFLLKYRESSLSTRLEIHTNCEYSSKNILLQVVIYKKILKFISDKQIIYFFPWISMGGADKVSIDYTSVMHAYSACVITNINSGTRINQIKIPYLDLPSECLGWDSLSDNERSYILLRAIINSQVKLIHIVNSEIAMKLVKYYANVLKEYGIKIIVTLFCPDYDWVNNQYHGFPVIFPELFVHADYVLSDNRYWYDYFKKLNNNKDFKFLKLSSPAVIHEVSFKIKSNQTKKILWASRICNQKLFDILEEIAIKLPNYRFVLYGNKPGDDHNLAIFNRITLFKNVEFRGEYQNIGEIDLNEFDLYLYTALFDGIPTIILDMLMSGIPIVSANVGGISEALGINYPLLVNEVKLVDSYIQKIEQYFSNPSPIILNMLEIRQRVIKEHDREQFSEVYNQTVKELLK